MEISIARLADLLVDPREDLDFEVKNWLDLQNDNEDKATFAKTVLAIANHGGGFIALGLTEIDAEIVEAPGRPVTMDRYHQDLINGIVQNYCDPSFHCTVHLISNRDNATFPVVIVPGGHRVPIRARRAGPHGNTIQNNAIYIRKPGPRSEVPMNAQDWDNLLAGILHNRRDEMFGQIRDLITGAVPQVTIQEESNRLNDWIQTSFERWRSLILPLPADVGPRFEKGFYNFSYEIIGDLRQIPPAQIPEVLQRSVVSHTGWPPFWYPTRAGIAPYPLNDAIECWLGGDQQTPIEDRDPAHSDFWRIHPQGLAFLLRGYQEDNAEVQRPGRDNILPGTCLDITSPVWRVGETLLQAESLANNLFEGPATIKFVATFKGLENRSLISVDGRRDVWQRRQSRQDTITLTTHIDAQAIGPNLPEIVLPLLSPLYSLFDFFELPMQLVADELARMRAGNF